MKIKVTQEYINKGEKTNPSCCPVALALTETLEDRIMVGTQWFVADKSPKYLNPLPQEARQFIADFDDGKEVQPFEFEINLEEQYGNRQNY